MRLVFPSSTVNNYSNQCNWNPKNKYGTSFIFATQEKQGNVTQHTTLRCIEQTKQEECSIVLTIGVTLLFFTSLVVS